MMVDDDMEENNQSNKISTNNTGHDEEEPNKRPSESAMSESHMGLSSSGRKSTRLAAAKESAPSKETTPKPGKSLQMVPREQIP